MEQPQKRYITTGIQTHKLLFYTVGLRSHYALDTLEKIHICKIVNCYIRHSLIKLWFWSVIDPFKPSLTSISTVFSQRSLQIRCRTDSYLRSSPSRRRYLVNRSFNIFHLESFLLYDGVLGPS